MNEEGKFWVSIWSVVAGGIVLLASLLVFSTHLTDKKIVEMVSLGANPVVARCSFSAVRNEEAILCMEAVKNESK